MTTQITTEEYKAREKSKPLQLSGFATDHIWIMEDIDGYIGIRLDCGDSGTVYLTKAQAKELRWQLDSYLKEYS
jgi:hypothetical protein